VLGKVGAGGMGEVYRAHDTRLRRPVALKVLPDALRLDPARVARFEHEARALASLNHPGIAAIYGIAEGHDAETAEPIQALVLEFVEGGTLADRIARGPIPVPDSLSIARQIADALEAAHDKGIVHRDLKPGNVAITSDGIVKVLDFGLAKIAATEASASMETETVGATREGAIVGTAAYMSPEQASGTMVDKRSDIWAFGCTLFEMLTGARLFAAGTTAETIARVMTGEIDWSALPTEVPSAVVVVLRRCLERDRRRRLGDVAAIRFALDLQEIETPSGASSQPTAWPSSLRLWAAVAAVVVIGALLVAGYAWTRPLPVAPRVVRLSIPQTQGGVLTVSGTTDSSGSPDLALTPDGSQLVYVGDNGTRLLVRALDSSEVRPIASGSQLRNPFVSPRGDWVGYADRRYVLKRVAIGGGAPQPLPAVLDTDLAGAAWVSDEAIVFATFGESLGLRRTTAVPGTPSGESEILTKPDPAKGEVSHLWPEALPGGRAVLFTVTYRTGGLDAGEVRVLDLLTMSQKTLVRGGTGARFLPSGPGSTRGYLVYAAQGGLIATSFDAVALTASGPALPVVPRVAMTAGGAANFAVSPDGTLVHVNAAEPALATMVWVNDAGVETPIPAPPHRYSWVRIAPDATRLALGYSDPSASIAIWDIRRSTFTALRISSVASINGPVWTSDSRRLLFQGRVSNGPANIWWSSADGSDVERLTTTAANPQRPTSVTPDGSKSIFMEGRPSLDVMELTLDAPRRVRELIHVPGSFDAGGVISPDGHWLAYESDVSGRMEVYVCSYPDVTNACSQISTAGGNEPRWLPRTGREIFFVTTDGAVMRVRVDLSSATLQLGPATKAFHLLGTAENFYGSWDIAPDGRAVLIKQPARPPEINVVLNWTQELARLLPARIAP
jgi:serine/threonine-protein kinase